MGICDSPNEQKEQKEQKNLPNIEEPIPNETDIKINKQLKLSICKIYGNNNKIGTGFLCGIPYQSYSLPVLITNKSIINKEELLEKGTIEITFDNEREERTINITSQRKIFTSRNYDIIIIEIKPKEDDININQLLETDNVSNENYKNKNIYILQYINGKECLKSFGKIIENNGVDIKHSCEKYPGGPILLLDNLKVIGINTEFGNGTLLRESINEFNAITNNNNEITKINPQINNTIECIYKINNEEELDLLHDFKKDLFATDQELMQLYNEGKKKIKFIEENINIYIDSQPIKFNYKYKTNKNIIQVKFQFRKQLNDLSFLFSNCLCLESVDLSSFDTTNITNMNSMFDQCSTLKKVNLKYLKSNNDINMKYMFNGCLMLKSIELPDFGKIKVSGMKKMFNKCTSLESINLICFDTCNVNDMTKMFSECKSLKSINLSSFNTSNVKDMSNMFSYCQCLKSLDLSKFNTKNVTKMNGMFLDCRSLISLDLSSFNTNNVKDMNSMFMFCQTLKSINLSSFNTINVIDLNNMFNGCESLKSIDLSSFKTPNVANIEMMFIGCKNLQSIDLSSFTTIKVNNNNNLSQLKQLLLYQMSSQYPEILEYVSDNIFAGCFSLRSIKCKDKKILEMFESTKKFAESL